MSTIATIQSINNGSFLVKYNGEITKAYTGQELPSGCEIIPDSSNTELSYMEIFVPSLNKTITLTGQESILLDNAYFELLSLLNDPNNPIVEQTDSIEDEQAKNEDNDNDAFLKEVENMDASAAGGPQEDNASLNDPTLKSLNYKSEYQISSEYETINLADLSSNNSFESNKIYNLEDPLLPSNLVINLNSFSIEEEAIDINSVIAKVNVNDLNNRDYPLTYTITNTPNPEYYNINQETGEVTLTQAAIDAINDDSNIDLNSLDFTIIASDGIDSVSQDISIDINRVDDNQPTFDTTQTTLIEESLASDESVAKVIMHDKDDGDLNEDYSMSIDPNNNYFTIDETGNIFLTQDGIETINSDEGVDLGSISVDVIISNGEDSITKTIDFEIARINDNPMVLDSLETNSITENAISTDTVVGTASVSDLDDTSFEYSLDGEQSDYLTVDENGVITLTQEGVNAINDDSNDVDLSTLNATLKISDTQSEDTIERDFTIDVNRVNDNTPVLNLDNTNNNITEQSIDTTTIVAQLSATDADNNTTIDYSIKANLPTSDYFSIDTNGVVTLTQSGVDAINSDNGLDITTLNFDVIASDGVHAVEQNVPLNIARVNDNAPVINVDTQNTLTEESINVGDTIAQISSSDLDDTDSITYSKAADTPNADYFTIDQDGKITITQEGIDAINGDNGNDISTFDIKVNAFDGSFNTANTISIDVTRVYDNAPEIKLSNFAQLSYETVTQGNTVAKIFFSDFDDNDNVTYEIVSGNDNDYFDIDNDTDSIIVTDAGATYIQNERTEDTITNLFVKGTDLGGNEVVKSVLVQSIGSQTVIETDFPADGYLDGTPSDDNIEYDNTPIDGKAGVDTFFLQNNENIDLSGIAKNIEKIDLSVNGTHTIENLTIDDVINATDTSNDLIIYGNFDDSVALKNETGKEWQNDGEVVENGTTYTQFSDVRDSGDPSVVLKISQDVDTQVI